jgi:hypothetical protein
MSANPTHPPLLYASGSKLLELVKFWAWATKVDIPKATSHALCLVKVIMCADFNSKVDWQGNTA